MEKENHGLGDETLNKFREFMDFVENGSEEDLQCAICLELLHRPHEIDPCHHRFCASCLIRLSQARRLNCPLCRTAINDTILMHSLNERIRTFHPDEYLRRQNLEEASGISYIPMIWISYEVSFWEF